MAKKKPTAKQLKARAKFVKMVRAKAKASKKKKKAPVKKAKIKGDTIVTYRGSAKRKDEDDKEFLMERDKDGTFRGKMRMAGDISNKNNISRLQDFIRENKNLQDGIDQVKLFVKVNSKKLSARQKYTAKIQVKRYQKEISSNKKMITILKSLIK